jgi:hypothetical protein
LHNAAGAPVRLHMTLNIDAAGTTVSGSVSAKAA